VPALRMTPATQPGGAQRRPSSTPGLRGCELWLFQERKTGNLDCTFCLDCVHACPHDNVGIIGRMPGSELWLDGYRSGVGRLAQRTDLAALVAVLIFASFVNAFAMIRPVYTLRERLLAWLGPGGGEPVLLSVFLLGLIVLPACLLALAGWATRRLAGKGAGPLGTVIRRYVYALVPLGFGMWLAHYSFHFLSGGLTIVPVAQSFLSDSGLSVGQADWVLGPLVPLIWLYPIEAFFLYLGATGSLLVTFQIARRFHVGSTRGQVLAAALPWFVLCLVLLAAGLWILVQPMDMRGTLMMSTAGG
jgi:hypothetical protein